MFWFVLIITNDAVLESVLWSYICLKISYLNTKHFRVGQMMEQLGEWNCHGDQLQDTVYEGHISSAFSRYVYNTSYWMSLIYVWVSYVTYRYIRHQYRFFLTLSSTFSAINVVSFGLLVNTFMGHLHYLNKYWGWLQNSLES